MGVKDRDKTQGGPRADATQRKDGSGGTFSRPGMAGLGTVAASRIVLGLVIDTRGRSLTSSISQS